jgi:surfeit locus 1 family protein
MVENAAAPERRTWIAVMLGGVAFLVLLGLGTWQVERLRWKEALIATIDERMSADPLPLAAVEAKFAAGADVDYWPTEASGVFLHEGERHFLATHGGQSGFFVYTPLRLDDGRFVFVNRGFVPYDMKEPAKREAGQVPGRLTVTGLARNPLAAKPSVIVPDNDPAKNVFFWKDIEAFAATAGLPADAAVLPFFIDAGPQPVAGGLPIGGVTLVHLPNNHLQYAVTWYGLAAALAGVLALFVAGRSGRRRKGV